MKWFFFSNRSKRVSSSYKHCNLLSFASTFTTVWEIRLQNLQTFLSYLFIFAQLKKVKTNE